MGGPGAEDPDAVAALHRVLSEPWPGPSRVHDEPSFFLARALATRALTPGPLRCNLRAGPLAHPETVGRLRRLDRRAAVWAAAAGLLLCAANVAVRAAAAGRMERMDAAFLAAAEQAAGTSVGEARGEYAIRTVRDAVGRQVEALRPLADALGPGLAGRLAGISGIGRERNLRYALLVLDGSQVTIKGTGADWSSGEALQEYLQQEGYAVRLDRGEALVEERVPFTLSTVGAPP